MTDDDSDAMLDRLDRREPAASKEEAEAREPYERLISRIRDLPDDAPPDGWESRAEARRHQVLGTKPRRRRWLAAGVAALAAAATLIATLVTYCRVPAQQTIPRLTSEVSLVEDTDLRGSGAGIVGDFVEFHVTNSRLPVEVRIYRDDELVDSFSGTGAFGGHHKTKARGTYRVLLIVVRDVKPPPSMGYIDDKRALDAAGFTVIESPEAHLIEL
jgi:hypothetical protein